MHQMKFNETIEEKARWELLMCFLKQIQEKHTAKSSCAAIYFPSHQLSK